MTCSRKAWRLGASFCDRTKLSFTTELDGPATRKTWPYFPEPSKSARGPCCQAKTEAMRLERDDASSIWRKTMTTMPTAHSLFVCVPLFSELYASVRNARRPQKGAVIASRLS